MNTKLAKLCTAFATVAALVLAAGCGGQTPTTTGSAAESAGAGGEAKTSLTFPLFNDIGQPADPDIYYSGNGLMILTNTYEGLVKYASGNHTTAEIVPSLATEWSYNDDFTEFTFKLREGVKFHDGTDFTSAAVEASFERRRAVDGGPAYMVADVIGYDTPDDYTVTVKLSKPNSAFLDFMASPYGPRIISPTVIAANAADNAQAYIAAQSAGTGPYKMTIAEADIRYQIEYFEDYWGETEPQYKTLTLKVFSDTASMELGLESGELDAIVGAVPSASQERFVTHETLKGYQLPTFQVGMVYMNPNRDFFNTKEMRQAFYNAVDWANIIQTVEPYKSQLATTAYSLGAVEGDSITITHDPAPFEALVAALPAGTKVAIGYNASSDDDAAISNIIAAQLQALGLQAEASAHKTAEIFGDWPVNPANAPDLMVNSGTWPDANNGYLFGHVFWDLDGGLNFLGCADDALTAALAKALESGDPADYVAAGKIDRDVMCTPTWAQTKDFIVAQPWLGGIEESHSMAEPYALDILTLTYAG
ncbi:MAG: ABC transporter substrate-binding protein [Propionibacteriaceae bacterium]|jgi:peptide/nickel transport system substrate-binding protein|nr:ABC transporter substrate-binding protein [Propionibacteriaceae bacterium]